MSNMSMYGFEILCEWEWNDSKVNDECKCHYREQQISNADQAASSITTLDFKRANSGFFKSYLEGSHGLGL